MSAARNTWAKHYQSVWEEQAADPALADMVPRRVAGIRTS